MLTSKFKALLAANLKKHNLSKGIETKVEALYVTKQKRDPVAASTQMKSTNLSWAKPMPVRPPPFYEKYLPLTQCETAEHSEPTAKLYLKGQFFYDSVEDNPDYDYTWGFVRVPNVIQPIKIRGL